MPPSQTRTLTGVDCVAADYAPLWPDLDGVDRANIVDCAVNANIHALMASLDARELPGFAKAVDMIVAAVDCASKAGPAGRRSAPTPSRHITPPPARSRRSSTTPVVRRDRARGITGPPGRSGRRGPEGETALWCNAYADPVWHCRALQLLTEERVYPEVVVV